MLIAEFDQPDWQIPQDVLANASEPVIDTFPSLLAEGAWECSDQKRGEPRTSGRGLERAVCRAA